MKNHYFLLRFDDICPTMDWEQWNRAKKILDKYELKPLLGVIPDCQDSKLYINEERLDFWEYIRHLQKEGYVIAMHGYTHQYITKNPGLVGVGHKSEFSGLSYEEQYEKLKNGKKIFEDQGINVDIFFAPSHSYDNTTLKALSNLGFKWVSDGKGFKAIKYHDIVLLPCINGGIPKIFLSQYVTVVIHAQEWILSGKEKGYEQYKTFCEKYFEQIVDFACFSNQPIGNCLVNRCVERIITFYQREFKPILSKIKRRIMNYYGGM